MKVLNTFSTRIILLAFSFVFVATQLVAQEKPVTLYTKKKKISINSEDPIMVTWVRPGDGKTAISKPLPGDQLAFELIVKSEEDLGTGNFTVLLNGSTHSKSNEAGLLDDVDGGTHEYTYSNKLPLVRGENEITILIKKGGQVIEEASRTIRYEPQEAKREFAIGVSRMEWHTPNLFIEEFSEKKPYVCKDEKLEFQMTIYSEQAIQLEDVFPVLNGQIFKPTKQALWKDGHNGVYVYRDKLPLPDADGFLYLQVRKEGFEIKSEKLYYRTPKANLYVIAIGTQNNLLYAPKDAVEFSNLFQDQGGPGQLYNEVDIKTLTGQTASAENIKAEIESLGSRFKEGTIQPNDMVMIFISAHGFMTENNDFRIQGHNYDRYAQRSTSVSYHDEILPFLENVDCKKMLFLDACRSGGTFSGDALSDVVAPSRFLKGLTVFTSSQGNQLSYEDDKWKNGAFTEAILKAIQLGKADRAPKDGVIYSAELYEYLLDTVPDMVQKRKQRAQIPARVIDQLGDIPLVRIQ